nr:hypothetical protein Iba_chr08aCG12440 [Ipomoea batatas]
MLSLTKKQGGEVEEYEFTNVLTIRCDCDHRKMVKSGDFLETACMNLTELQRYWSPSVFENRNVTDLDGLRLSPRVLFSFRKIIRHDSRLNVDDGSHCHAEWEMEKRTGREIDDLEVRGVEATAVFGWRMEEAKKNGEPRVF